MSSSLGLGKALLGSPLPGVRNKLTETRQLSVTLAAWEKLHIKWKWNKINLLALKIPEGGGSWAARQEQCGQAQGYLQRCSRISMSEPGEICDIFFW